MNDVFKLDEKPHLRALQERRKNSRKACSIKAHHMVKGHWHKGSVQNISKGGAHIGPFEGRTFSPGME
jgi:hypothetical protein